MKKFQEKSLQLRKVLEKEKKDFTGVKILIVMCAVDGELVSETGSP